MAEKEAPKKPDATEIKVMGQPAMKTILKDGTITVTMKKDQYNDILEKKGITAEVRKVMEDGLRDVAKDAIIAAKDMCLKGKGANVEMRLGTGSFSQNIRLTGHKEFNGRNPSNGEPIHTDRYGVVDAELNLSWGRDFKGEDGLLKKVADECRSFFESKAKK